jgi:hypothetical protein
MLPLELLGIAQIISEQVCALNETMIFLKAMGQSMDVLVGAKPGGIIAAQSRSKLQAQYQDGSHHRATHIARTACSGPERFPESERQVLRKLIARGEDGQDGLRAGVALLVKDNGLLNFGLRHSRFSRLSIEKTQFFPTRERLGTRLHIQLGIDVADMAFHSRHR